MLNGTSFQESVVRIACLVAKQWVSTVFGLVFEENIDCKGKNLCGAACCKLARKKYRLGIIHNETLENRDGKMRKKKLFDPCSIGYCPIVVDINLWY